MKIFKNKKVIKIILISIVSIGLITILLINIFKKDNVEYIDLNSQSSLSSKEVSYEEILVNVTGEVKKPGIYSIKSGSIVSDAIKVAGGFSEYADVDSVNLIAKIKDGERILVKRLDESSDLTKVNINIATVRDLMTLPGIGEAKASAIITYRSVNGNFNSIEEIMNVQGISESIYLKIKDSITVK